MLPGGFRDYILLNFALMTLCGGVVTMTTSRALPGAVPIEELKQLSAGVTFVGSGGANATNPQSNASNRCYYCTNVGAPANGAIKCTDNAQITSSGPNNYASMVTADCSPEARFSGSNCTGTATVIGTTCTNRTKTTFSDP